jgi:hypothetical protein
MMRRASADNGFFVPTAIQQFFVTFSRKQTMKLKPVVCLLASASVCACEAPTPVGARKYN